MVVVPHSLKAALEFRNALYLSVLASVNSERSLCVYFPWRNHHDFCSYGHHCWVMSQNL